METLLVAGVDSIVGANLAATLADRYRVVGLALATSEPVTIAGCEIALCLSEDAETLRQQIAGIRPEHIVYCGPAAHSCWNDRGPALTNAAVQAAANWAKAASDAGCRLTVISSDAVFTGPWMFHKENSESFCPSPQAAIVRNLEQRVLDACPQALVVRTNAYGWSVEGSHLGWIERLLSDLEADVAGPIDYIRHGTPIHASDLAEILARAWGESLTGLYHIAGAERVNPSQFAAQLADEFDLPAPIRVRGESLTERPAGFGCGETSLHTKQIRMALCVAMPTVAEGLRRLREQTENGYCDRLQRRETVHERVA